MWILRKFWPYVAIAGLVALVLLTGRRVVVLEEALKRQTRKIEKQQEMHDAGANTPRDRDSVTDSMRDGSF